MEKTITFLNENIALLGLVVVLILGVLINPLFSTPENLSNLLRTTSITGFVAIGMTFVILCGSIDLSVSSVFSLSGFLFIYFSCQSKYWYKKFKMRFSLLEPITSNYDNLRIDIFRVCASIYRFNIQTTFCPRFY